MITTTPLDRPVAVETFHRAGSRLYEIYDTVPGREHLLIGYQHERAYLVDRGPRERCHPATHLLHFGGLPLIEYAPDVPPRLRRALSAVVPAHAAA
jgi:hypothetical protein